jgi:hypothetical protein
MSEWKKSAADIRQQNVDSVASSQKRARAPKHPLLEEDLALWFHKQEARSLIFTNDIPRAQAKRFAHQFNVPESFAFSDGWLTKFKSRHGIKRIVLHGGASSADPEEVQLARCSIRLIAADSQLDDIYNQDETGVFWRRLPMRTLATGKHAGRKKDQLRITLSLTCNASGTDKREFFLIGRAKPPRMIPKNFHPERYWGIRYRSNAKAWMMSAEFSSCAKF